MIRFTLRCPKDHRFDSWFPSAEAFDRLQAAGHLSCAECGDASVEKALMAPAVASARADAVAEDRVDPRMAALQALKARIEAETDYVGDGFAREARAIHDGAAPERPIWGEARPDEARALIEDGIPVAPLPFVPTRKTN